MKRETVVQVLTALLGFVGICAAAVAICLNYGWFGPPADGDGPLEAGATADVNGPLDMSRAPDPNPSADFDPARYYPRDVLGRPMPVIDKIPVKSVTKIKTEVDDDELVLGVEVGGEFRAYPINQMTGPHREVFNDTLGGAPIAATW